MQTSVLLPNSNNIIKKCPGCMSSVFANDAQVSVSESPWHKVCFKCSECKCQLTLSNYTMAGEIALCKTHYFTRFYKSNSYGGGDKFTKKSVASELKEENVNIKIVDSSESGEHEVISSVVSIEKMMQKFTTNEPSPTSVSKKLDEVQVPITSEKSNSVLPKSNSKFKPTQAIKCPGCTLTVYHNDPKVTLEGNTWHNSCFKCQKCKCQLTLSNYTLDGVKALCKTHYLEQFHLSNSYAGEEKFLKAKTSTSSQDDETLMQNDKGPLSPSSEDDSEASSKCPTGSNSNVRWECTVCSLKNMPIDTICSLCQAPRMGCAVQNSGANSVVVDIGDVVTTVPQQEVISTIANNAPTEVYEERMCQEELCEASTVNPDVETESRPTSVAVTVENSEVLGGEVETTPVPSSLPSQVESVDLSSGPLCPPAPTPGDGKLVKDRAPLFDDCSALLSPSAVAKAQTQKPMRFVGQPKCYNCNKSVYHNDLKVQVNEQLFHQACFKCAECDCKLTLSSFTTGGDKVYCKPHYFALFHKNNGYAGAEQFKRQ